VDFHGFGRGVVGSALGIASGLHVGALGHRHCRLVELAGLLVGTGFGLFYRFLHGAMLRCVQAIGDVVLGIVDHELSLDGDVKPGAVFHWLS